MNNTFTLSDALEIQAEHLNNLSLILKPEIFNKVRELVLSTNTVEQQPYNVCRGTNIDMLVKNIALRLKDGYILSDLGIDKYFNLTYPKVPTTTSQLTINDTDNIKIEAAITFKTFLDIIVTALEGGSNYWYDLGDLPKDLPKQAGEYSATSERVALYIWQGGKLPIYDIEDENEVLGILSLENVVNGFKLAMEQHPTSLANILTENYDAGDADVLFQLFIISNVVFG